MRDSLKPLACLLLLVAYVSASGPVTNAPIVCADHIFGCTECREATATPGTNATVATKQQTCTWCRPNLYLYKYWATTAKTYLNVCVPNCADADRNTVADHVHMQCIYLGPYCGFSGVTSTVGGNPNRNHGHSSAGSKAIDHTPATNSAESSPMCQYSYMDDKGFVLGSRYEIVKWLMTETYLAPNQTFAKSLAALKEEAAVYEAPLQTTPIGQQAPEYNVKVVAKCQSVYCNLCESFNLTSCVTCWGRFADLATYGSCRPARRTCNVLHKASVEPPNRDFRLGCYQTQPDCAGCAICDYGWTSRTASTSSTGLPPYCYNCTEIHPNCTECAAMTGTTPSPAGNTVVCTLCADGWGLRSGNCSLCTGAHVKQCDFNVTSGEEVPLLCNDGYILDRTNTTCKRTCDHHEFPQVDFDKATNTENKVFCTDCDPACRSCARYGSDQCLTCKGQTYLKLPTSYARKGPCANKTVLNSTSPVTQREVQIVVLNVNNADVKDQYKTEVGIQPSFMAAVFQAFQQATETVGANVTIFLETGDHYVTRTYMDAYILAKEQTAGVDWTNPEFFLIIKPLDCSDVSSLRTVYRSTACRTSSTPRPAVRIFNKVGAHFHVQVPQRLLWEGIYLDALDSLVKYYSPTTNNLGQDCKWTKERVYSCPSVNNKTLMIDIDTNPICGYRSYGSIFQMRTIDRNVTKPSHIHRLEIENSTFANVFYEIGSIVRLPENVANQTLSGYEWPWNLTITGSEFLNMSFCGSVVSNDYPLFAGTPNNPITYFNDGLRQQIKSFYGPAANNTRANSTNTTSSTTTSTTTTTTTTSTTPHKPNTTSELLLDCSAAGAVCHDLIFTNNTIQNHFMLKSPGDGSPYFQQKVNWQMLKFGLVLHLNHFKGNLTIAKNQISDVRINFNDICTYYEPLTTAEYDKARAAKDPATTPAATKLDLKNKTSFEMTATTAWTELENFYRIHFNPETQYLIPMQNSIHQVISLIVIDNFADGQWVNITDNQFNRNIVGNSLISISQAVNTVRNSSYQLYQGEVIIKNNIFNESAAYIGTNAITITKQDNSNVTNKVDIYNYCGRGIQITNNTFRRVVGTCQTDTGLVRIQCNNTDFAKEISQAFSFVNITRQISPAQGRMGKVFNSTSLETLRPRFIADPKNDTTIISGNRIINCSSGIAQRSTKGVRGHESTYIESFQGSLFALTDVLLLEFSNNAFEGVFRVNDLQFYQENSPHYKFFKQQTVKSIQGVKVQNQLINNDESAAVLTAVNVYELNMQNSSFWHVDATKFKDAVILYSQSGMKNISIGSAAFVDVSQVDKLFFKSLDVGYLDLVSVQMFLEHTVTLKDLVFNTVSIKPTANPYPDALLYDNFHGEFTIKDFRMQNVSLTNLTFNGDFNASAPQIPSGLMYVAAGSISLSQLNFQNLTLYQKVDTGGPIRLQIFNFTNTTATNITKYTPTSPTLNTTMRPKIYIQNSTFRNVNFTCIPKLAVTPAMGARGGLLTFFHDALQYDVDISDTIFDGIQMLFEFNSQTTSTFSPTVATLLQTRQTNLTDLYVARMAMTIKNSVLKDVYQAQTKKVKQQLLNFQKPIANLYLDGTQFIGIEKQWHLFDLEVAALLDDAIKDSTTKLNSTTIKEDAHKLHSVQVMQTFDPATGPQQVFIKNTAFATSRIQHRDVVRQKQIKDPNYSGPAVTQATLSIDTIAADSSQRYFFDFRNYSYTAPVNATSSSTKIHQPSQFAHFQNVTVSNIDFNYQLGDIPRAGSFMRSMQSNIVLDGIVAANISSRTNGAFLQVLDTLDEGGTVEVVQNATSISIMNSSFTNCTSKVGGVIYYYNKEPKNVQSFKVAETEFDSNYANVSGVMDIYAQNQTFAFTGIAMDGNLAGTNNSMGSICNNGNNTVVFDRIQFSHGNALNGTNSIVFRDTSASMSNMRFSDNFATMGASTIKFEGAYAPGYAGTQPSLLIRNSTFESSQYNTLGLKQVFGAYLNIGYTAQAKSTDYFGPRIVLQGNAFRLGSARGGGAIYAAGINSIDVTIEDSDFDNNKAYINGGTIMFDELDEYLISINRTNFAYNLGRKYGDNFYARQTKSTKAVNTRRRMLPAAAGTAAAAPRRTIKMNQINQTTPLTYNQMYFEGIQTLELNMVIANKILDSQALEGASIYCLNCYKVVVSNSSFVGQNALIRGGAIFLRQNTSTNFGQPWTGAAHNISATNFTNCSSQQGGALYTKFVHNSIIGGKNIFYGSEALLYDQELQVQTSLDDEVKKTYLRITDQARRGKGPALFFDCTYKTDSTLEILKGAQFIDSKVYDVALGKDVESTGANHAIVKALYYTQCAPIVPLSMSTLVEQSFVASYFGTNGVFFANLTDYDAFKPIMATKLKDHETLTYVVQPYLAVTDNKEFRLRYHLDDFSVRGTTIFGDLPIAIVNDRRQVQIYDSVSLLTLEAAQATSKAVPKLKNNTTIPVMLLQKGRNATRQATFQATNGIITVPKLQIQATPGQEITLRINFTILNSNSTSTKVINDLVFMAQACSAGEVINTNGTCSMCSGPDYYLLKPAETTTSGAVHIEDCSICNKTVMTCKGGANLSSNVGYQRLNVQNDLFIKCGQIHNSSTCLAENRCEEGYQGLMCKECAPHFYRDFDGQCQQCSLSSDGRNLAYSDGAYTLFRMAFNVIIVILVVKSVTELTLSGQSKNSISSGFYLFKNIANYVIFFVLLSQIFSIYWTREGHDPNTYLKYYVETMRVLYRIPLKTSDMQCYHDGTGVSLYKASDIASVVVPLQTTDVVAAQVGRSAAAPLGRRAVQLVVMASLTTALLAIAILQNTLCPPKTLSQQEQDRLAARFQGQVEEKMQEQQDLDKSKSRAMLKELHDRNNAQAHFSNSLHHDQLAQADRASHSVTNAGDVQSNYESAYSRATSNFLIPHDSHQYSQKKLLDRGAFDNKRSNVASSQQFQLPRRGADVVGLQDQELAVGGDMQYEAQSQHQTRHLQDSMRPQMQRDGLSAAASMDLRGGTLPASALRPQAGMSGFGIRGQSNNNVGRGQDHQQYEGGDQDHQDVREARRPRSHPRQQDTKSVPGSSSVAGQSQINIQNLNYVVQNDNSMRMGDEQGINFFSQHGHRLPPIQAPDERKTPFFDEGNPKGVSRTDQWRLNAQTPLPGNGRPRSEHPGGVPVSNQQQLELGYANDYGSHENYGQSRLSSAHVAASPSKILRAGQHADLVNQQQLGGGLMLEGGFGRSADAKSPQQYGSVKHAVGQGLAPQRYPGQDLRKTKSNYNNNQYSGNPRGDDVSQRSAVTDHRSVIGGRSVRSRRTDLDSNSVRRKILHKRAEVAEQKEKTQQRLRRYQFQTSTIAVMVFGFVMNTQITQQFLLYLACQDVEFAGPLKDSQPTVAFNYYDSAMACDSSTISNSGTFFCFLGYVLIWVVLAPTYLLLKNRKEFIIEYFGLIIKLVLVVVAQFAPFMTEFQVGVAGAFLITFQFLIFMIFRSGQVAAESQKIVKLQELNTIDFTMYLSLCLTGYVSLVFIIFDLSLKVQKMLYLIILVVNVLYLVFWLFKVARYGLKHLKATPKLAHIYICLTCDYFGDQPKTRQEKGKEMQELNDIEEIRNQDLEKIDILIEHLQDVQKEIIMNKEKPGEDGEGVDDEVDAASAGRKGFINQNHLFDEIDEILNPDMDSGRGETIDEDSNAEPIFVQSGRDFDLQSQMVVPQSQLAAHVPDAAGRSDRVYSHDDIADSDSGDEGARIQFQQQAQHGAPRNFQAADFQSPSRGFGQREVNQFSLAKEQMAGQGNNQVQNPFEKDAAKVQTDEVQANYFNDTFSKNEIQNSLKQIQQEGQDPQYPQIEEMLVKLQEIDYANAAQASPQQKDGKATDELAIHSRESPPRGGSAAAEQELPASPQQKAGAAAKQNMQAQKAAEAKVVSKVETEIERMMSQLSHLDADLHTKPGFDAVELAASMRESREKALRNATAPYVPAPEDSSLLRAVGGLTGADASGELPRGSAGYPGLRRGATEMERVMEDLDALNSGIRARQPGPEPRASTLKDFLDPDSQTSLHANDAGRGLGTPYDDLRKQRANVGGGLPSQRSGEENFPLTDRQRPSPRLENQPSGERARPDDLNPRSSEQALMKGEEQKRLEKEQKAAMKKKMAEIMNLKKKRIELQKATEKAAQLKQQQEAKKGK